MTDSATGFDRAPDRYSAHGRGSSMTARPFWSRYRFARNCGLTRWRAVEFAIATRLEPRL